MLKRYCSNLFTEQRFIYAFEIWVQLNKCTIFNFLYNSVVFLEEEQFFFGFTPFMPLASFYTPWKHQKTFDFLIFSGRIERTSGMKQVNPFHNKFSFISMLCSTQEQILNPFQPNALFLYPLETPENQRFSEVFRGYRNGTLG